MRPFPPFVAITLAAALTACVHTPDAVATAPDYAPITSDPAPPNARLYADCIDQAAASGDFRRASDGGGDLDPVHLRRRASPGLL